MDPHGLVGGFSEAYDMISSQYGWTDEVIGDLPFGRFTQIISSIRTRKYQSDRQENLRVSWMTRMVSSFIAGGYMIAEDTENEALNKAVGLSLDRVERAYLGSIVSSRKPTVGATADGWEPGMAAIIPDSKLASMDKIMSVFGR